MFDRRVDGKEHTFGVSGKLIMNNLVMWDRQTSSLWLQITGEGIDGEHRGEKLATVPHTQTTWAAWLDAHPDTLLLDKNGGYQRDTYADYYQRSSAGALGRSGDDDRLPAKDLVVGYVAGGRAKGYPFRALMEQPVINDEFGGDQIAIVFDEQSQTGQIFLREVEGELLTLDLVERTETDIILRDEQTGTRWSGVTGEGLSGPLEAEQLDLQPSFYAFWFAWSDFFIEAELYEG